MKYLIGIILILVPIYFFTMPQLEKEISDNIEKVNSDAVQDTRTIKLLDNDEIIEIELEEYILGVVACEMPILFENEALKAQAVASRTYALERINGKKKYDLENSVSNQCYHDNTKLKKKWGKNFQKYYEKLEKIIFDTKGQYLTYEDKIIKSFFFSTSNGKTENVEEVFVQKLDYLRSVDSSWDEKVKTFKREIVLTEKEFLKKLQIDDEKIRTIKINSYTTSGRINYISINNKKIRGTIFRNMLGLRSTDASIKIENNNVIIQTKGYGHGVGMSQYGANEMAKSGKKYTDVLFHYYTGVELKKI